MDTPNPPRPNSQRSEVDSFKADYDEIIGIVTGEHGRIVAETSDDADRFAVIADNFVSCMNLAQGLGVVLDQRNHEGSYVLFRALYESSINLMYLCDVGDRTHNALLARAYTLLEMAEGYREAGDHVASREYQSVYNKIPKALRDELSENRKEIKNHWSGVSLANRSSKVGFTGHRVMYRGTSWEAHAQILGRLQFQTVGEHHHVLTMSRSLAEIDAQNVARIGRQCLRQSWKRFSSEAFGVPIALSAPPPNTSPVLK